MGGAAAAREREMQTQNEWNRNDEADYARQKTIKQSINPAPHVVDRSTDTKRKHTAATDRAINNAQIRVTDAPELRTWHIAFPFFYSFCKIIRPFQNLSVSKFSSLWCWICERLYGAGSTHMNNMPNAPCKWYQIGK
jgi:hypothetical protein